MWENCLSGSVRGWGTTEVWPRYCGTTGKPGGNREHKLLPTALGVPSLLDKNSAEAQIPCLVMHKILGRARFRSTCVMRRRLHGLLRRVGAWETHLSFTPTFGPPTADASAVWYRASRWPRLQTVFNSAEDFPLHGEPSLLLVVQQNAALAEFLP